MGPGNLLLGLDAKVHRLLIFYIYAFSEDSLWEILTIFNFVLTNSTIHIDHSSSVHSISACR